jgi:hypothetical protein
MRKLFVSAFVLAALLVFATAGLALEKTAVRAIDERGDWNAGTSSCSVHYYNICTGYIWVWSGWAINSVLGTVYDTCCPPGDTSYLTGSYFYYRTAAFPGYGFTGYATIETVNAQDCPTGALAGPIGFYPIAGWNFFAWGVNVPSRFAQVHVIGSSAGWPPNLSVASDGPFACGVCYPTTRTTNSYTWGLTTSPSCPGIALNDGACNVEWLSAVTLTCESVSVEDESWGSIKNLYR